MNTAKTVFENNSEEDFFPVLRGRVNKYFSEKKISKNANGAMVWKTAVILSLFMISYLLLLTGHFSGWVMLLLAAANGILTALIGLNIAHDAIHGSYSRNKTVNKWLSLTFNIVGANDYMWRIMHNIIHHTYTNMPGHDDDINQMQIIRFSPGQKRWFVHRFQYIYVFLFYPLATLSWVFIKDYVKFFKSAIGKYDNSRHPVSEYFRLFGYKTLYYFLFLALPMIVIDLPWYEIIAGFVILHLFEGLTLSLIFQLAHVVEGPSFPLPGSGGRMPHTWAEHQMYTTANFACRSDLAYLLFGGLNFQIEHHLFPGICHIHYRALSPIVRKTAKEFGLPYYENRTFIGAIASHVRVLKRFGRDD